MNEKQDFHDDLEGWDDEYEEATPAGNEDFENVPDGTYQVKSEKVELRRSRAGNAMLSWQLRILTGDFEGRMLFKNSMLATSDNLRWLKTDLGICDLKLQKLSDLPDRLEDLLDITLEVYAKQDGDFQNVYFNKKLTTVKRDPDPSPPGDDLPF